MERHKISVIVPVYNAEKYLHRCIDSILSQNFTDFEVLLIDDGSRDSSGEICDEYARKDMRVKVYHNENHGVAFTRQFGIEHVSTDFFAFIDSDDFVDQQYLLLLYSEINSSQSDMTVCAYYEIGQKGKTLCCNYHYDKTTYIKALLSNKEWGVLWNKLFKKKIVDNFDISFVKQLNIWEDLTFVIEYLLVCSTISFVKEPLYCYDRTIAGSLTRKDSLSYYEELIDAVNKIEFVLRKYNNYSLFFNELNNLKVIVKDNCIKSNITREKIKLWNSAFPELGDTYFKTTTEKISAYLLKYKQISILKLFQSIRNVYRKTLL